MMLIAPLGRVGFGWPLLLTVASVEAISQVGKRWKLDAALIARFPSAAAPVVLQRNGDDFGGQVLQVGREFPRGWVKPLVLVFTSGDSDGGVGRIRTGQDAVMRQDLD